VFHDDEFARLPTTSRLPASVESAAIVNGRPADYTPR